MRISSGANFLRQASLGPAAIAARAKQAREINLGIPQQRFIGAEWMRHGGSMGAQLSGYQVGNPSFYEKSPAAYLGCCAGYQIGHPSFYEKSPPTYLGAVSRAPPVTIIGPIAQRMLLLRKQGQSPQAALYDALALLHVQGIKTVTPDIHLQLAAGLQPMPSGLSGLLGALGVAPIARSTLAASSLAAGTAAATGVTAAGLGAAIGLTQTVIPIPVVGAVIGAIVFEASQLLKRHVGKAEAAWNNAGFYNSLRTMNGRDYDEKQFSEAFKGMMDTGNNIVPGCGPDRHKNPDCLLGPMANVIAQGYLSGAVPLSATTSQVFNTVVWPWLMSGAGGLVNGRTLAAEPIQRLMMQAATDRYLAGQAMTRGDMPAYGNAGAHTPTLVQALQSILQQPTTSTPTVPPGSSAGGPVYFPPAPPTVGIQNPPSVGADPTIPPLLPLNYSPSLPVAGGGGGVTYSAPSGGPAVGYATPPSQPGTMTAAIGGGLPTWLTVGLAVVGLGMVFFRQGPVTSPPKFKRKSTT
jgi:hypothetical protein